eukprot:1321591-Pleurochrysis_carterae.AAC.1
MLPQHTLLGCQPGTSIAIPTRDSNGKRISISEVETQLKQIYRSLKANNDNFKLLLRLNDSCVAHVGRHATPRSAARGGAARAAPRGPPPVVAHVKAGTPVVVRATGGS